MGSDFVSLIEHESKPDCPSSASYHHEVLGRTEERVNKGTFREMNFGDRLGLTTAPNITCSLTTRSVGTDVCQNHVEQGHVYSLTTTDRDRKAQNPNGTHTCKR